MTFGYGSPGFQPFWCPPCSEGLCNVMCIDPIDGTLLIIGMVAITVIGAYATKMRTITTDNGTDTDPEC